MPKETEEEIKGKKTYCLNCKRFTLTIVTRDPGIFGLWPFKGKIRRCRDCAKVKEASEVEQE